MGKIGILTFHYVYNYGAVLQAYALQKVLTDMGCEVEFINYYDKKNWAMSLSFVLKIRYIVWNKFIKLIISGKTRQKRTDEFRKRNLNISNIHFDEKDQLEKEPPLYDAYITGSDQVWNFNITGYDPSYYLSFVPNDKPRISYAASFGLSKLPKQNKFPVKSLLEKMDNISVREMEGKHIVEDYANCKAEVVLDPTLLLGQDDWSKISSTRLIKENYILCYYMPGDSDVNKCIKIIADQIAKTTNWKVINIGQKEYHKLIFWKNSIFDAGPEEFISLFQNASFIITNSFHGTAFSINFRKPFYVPVNSCISAEKDLSSRITSLLNTLELKSRILLTANILENNNLNIELKVDYSDAEVILTHEKLKSLNFLRNALGKNIND